METVLLELDMDSIKRKGMRVVSSHFFQEMEALIP
jgi:hypothetical protein